MKGLGITLFAADKSIIVRYYLHFIRVYQNDKCCVVPVGGFELISLMKYFGYPGIQEKDVDGLCTTKRPSRKPLHYQIDEISEEHNAIL